MRRLWWWLAGISLTMLLAVVFVWRSGDVARQIAKSTDALAARDFAEARDLLQSLAKAAPEEAAVHFLLSRAERHLDNFSAARNHLARARKLGFPSQRIEREEMLISAQAGHLERVETHLSRLLDEPGDDLPDICEAFVTGYFRHLKFDSAERLLELWQKTHPADTQPFLLRASMWEHLKKWDKAEQAAREILKRAPDHKVARFGLAGALFRQNRYQAAAAEYRWCFENNAKHLEALSGWADCLFNLGENERAHTMFQQVLERDPEHFGAQLGAGRLALSDNKPQNALQWLKPAAQQRPFDLGTRYQLAMALKAVGQGENAQEHFDYVEIAQAKLDRYALLYDQVSQEPENLAVRYELGVIVLNYFDPAKGIFWLESVLKRDPHHAPTHHALADFFEKQGQSDRAAYHRQLAAREGGRQHAH